MYNRLFFAFIIQDKNMKSGFVVGVLIISLIISNAGLASYGEAYISSKTFYQPKMHNPNYNKFLNEHKNSQVEKLIQSYEHNFVSAINAGDFSIVSSDLLSGSKICKTQKNIVKSYSDRGIKERLISYKIKSMNEFQNGDFKVVVNERLYIQIGNKPMEYKEFENIYKVSRINNEYKMSKIISIKLKDSKIIDN